MRIISAPFSASSRAASGNDASWQIRMPTLPKSVVKQARGRLAELEQQQRDAPTPSLTPVALDQPQQFGLFAPTSAAVDALTAIDPDELTPKQALEALYRLKSLL